MWQTTRNFTTYEYTMSKKVSKHKDSDPQNFNCDNVFSFWSLQSSFVNIRKLS